MLPFMTFFPPVKQGEDGSATPEALRPQSISLITTQISLPPFRWPPSSHQHPSKEKPVTSLKPCAVFIKTTKRMVSAFNATYIAIDYTFYVCSQVTSSKAPDYLFAHLMRLK